MKKSTTIHSIIYLLLIFLVFSCKNNKNRVQLHNPQLYINLVHKLNDIVLDNNFSPVVASRNYTYATIASYEVIAKMPQSKYQSLENQIAHFPTIPYPTKDKGKLIDYHLSALLALIRVGNDVTFPEGSMMIEYDNIIKLAKKSNLRSADIKASVEFSEQVADIIIEWSKSDNYNKTRSAPKFAITTEEGRWVPTPPMYAPAIEPHWKTIRALTLDSSSQFKPIRPPAYNIKNKNSAFYKELIEVKNTVKNLTEDQKNCALFWDDNPFALEVKGHVMLGKKKYSPPGHWTNIIGLLCNQEKTSFTKTIAIYTHSCIALFDANISAWDEKYRSNKIRPETVINTHIDNLWRPFLQTPAFPAYTSGHSVVSNAVATILETYFPQVAFNDTTQLSVGGQTRKFNSIIEAGREASISRLYGGIHYRSDLEQGNIQGDHVGRWVLQKIKLEKE